MSNPNNLPIVGEENSHSSLKKETKQEGRKALYEDKEIEDCPYEINTTFFNWWFEGYNEALVEKY